MIHSVEVINWRAYEHRKIELGPGITFLMGSNGAGKTSILEAICYGLTGEAALFDSKTRPKLLRNPEQDATVNLTFDINGEDYCASRTQSPKSAAQAVLKHLVDGKVLAYNHSNSTRQISNLMGVSSDFLRRIVYMAEGDVFRFINQPPGEALEGQLRYVLGLTQLDEFVSALDNAHKQLKQEMAALQDLSANLKRLNIFSQEDLQNRLQAGENARMVVLKLLEGNQAQAIQIQTSLEGNSRIQGCLNEILAAQSEDPVKWIGLANMPLLKYYANLENEMRIVSQKREDIFIQIARAEGELEALHKVLEVFKPYEASSETLLCPICHKPMTEEERNSIYNDHQYSKDGLNRKIEDLTEINSKMEHHQEELNNHLSILKELSNLVTHGIYSELKPSITFEQISDLVSKGDEKRNLLRNLDQQKDDFQQRLKELQNQQAEFIAVQKRMTELGYDQPEEVNDALITLEIRSLSIRSAADAAKQTLVTQRNSDMQAIYDQIARLWGAFMGEDEWQIILDAKGLPTLQNESGRKFDLHQLSGGEKTALLIMLHTIIAHNFSKNDFIMVDEPLEHLDPVNRRSLIHFLVQSYRRGMFKQAIVATFEESLIRKYLSEDGVKAIMV